MANSSITVAKRPTIIALNSYIQQREVYTLLSEKAKFLYPKISKHSPYAVENVAVEALGNSIPKEIATVRVAVFYPNQETRIERHPNSDQYLFSLSGTGETRVLFNQNWISDVYGDHTDNSELEKNWHFVARNVWHQSVGRGNRPWALVALHSAKEVEDQYGNP